MPIIAQCSQFKHLPATKYSLYETTVLLSCETIRPYHDVVTDGCAAFSGHAYFTRGTSRKTAPPAIIAAYHRRPTACLVSLALSTTGFY